MTTPTSTTLRHAAELLEANAKSLRDYWNGTQNTIGIDNARTEYDDNICTALELRLLARSIQTGHAAVSPAPTFEGERK